MLLLGLRKLKTHSGSDSVKGGKAGDSKRGQPQSQVGVGHWGFLSSGWFVQGLASEEERLSGGSFLAPELNSLDVRNIIHPRRDLEDKWRDRLNHVNMKLGKAVQTVAQWSGQGSWILQGEDPVLVSHRPGKL